MKRLQRYYYLVGTPVALLALGTVLFFEQIANTVRGNPHPQINYVIFVLFVLGSVIMLMHVRRINREGELVQAFMKKLKAGEAAEAVSAWLKEVNGKGRFDVSELLEEVLSVQGRVVGAVEHSAIEAEVERYQSQQNRRLLLAQYFGGLMVGMGLFGTFVGLLGALEEIGNLIGAFSVGPNMTDPMAAVSELVTRLTMPMKAMGVAFSASLFGVLGSIVMGMLMVFVKGGAAELVALVHSRVSWLLNLSKATGGDGQGVSNVEPLQEALGELAQQAPLLKGLAIALDQSERRVRQLVESNTALAARLEQTAQTQQHMAQQAALQSEEQKTLTGVVQKSHQTQQQSLALQERGDARQQEWGQMFAQQQQLLQQVLTREQPWREVMGELAQTHAAQMQQLQSQWAQGLAALTEQVQLERSQWQHLAQGQSTEGQQMAQMSLATMERFERQQSQLSEQWQLKLQQQNDTQQWLADGQKQLAQLMSSAQQQLQSDSLQRLELAQSARQALAEIQARQEQMMHAVLSHKA